MCYREWRKQNSGETLDLSDADLTYAQPRSPNLRDANLKGANLGCADLGGANLLDASVKDAGQRHLRGVVPETAQGMKRPAFPLHSKHTNELNKKQPRPDAFPNNREP